MGLAAFAFFVLPWALLAVFLTRTPTLLRLGTTPAPWRPLPTHRDLAAQLRGDKAQPGMGGGNSPTATRSMPHGGALRPTAEPTEPTDKI